MKATLFMFLSLVLGTVYATTDINSAPKIVVAEQTDATGEAKTDPGQAIYDQYCFVCHRDGVAGAPKTGDEADWKPRLEGKTIDDLLATVISGLNAMPPKGTCVECSDDDLKAAIKYMLPKK